MSRSGTLRSSATSQMSGTWFRLIELLAQHGKAGEIYNLGSGRGTKLADALDYLMTLARCSIEIQVDPARIRPVDLPLLIADASKLRSQTGWEPRYTIEQTLTDMLDTSRATLR